MLTDDETRALILACAGAPGGASEADMERAVQWAERVRLDNLTLDMVLAGEMCVQVGEDGEPVFMAPEERSESDGE